MLKLLGKTLLGAVLGCLLASEASAAAPEEPHMVIVAGQRIVAVDKARSFWLRGFDQDDAWTKVEFAGEAKDALAHSLICAQNGSGKCVFTVTRGKLFHVLFDTATGSQSLIDLGSAETVNFANETDLYLARPGAVGGGKDILLFKTDSKTSTLLGTQAPTEILNLVAVDGQLTPIAFDSSLKARTLEGEGKSRPVNMPFSDDMKATRGDLLWPEGWGSDKPLIADRQTLTIVSLGSREGAADQVGAKVQVINTAALTGSVFVPSSIRVDANRDILAEIAAPQGRFIGLLCNAGSGRGFGTFVRAGLESSIEVMGSDAGPGFIVRIGDALTTGAYRYLSFPSAGGFSDRKCEGMKVGNIDLGIAPHSQAATFERTIGTATSADGTKIPYVVIKPKGRAPRSLIVHVYGAYGRMVGPEPYPDHILPEVMANDTAVVLPIVRGDGNLGYGHAVASRPPNRMKAVEDLLAVAEQLGVDFPGLKPMVRGGSAGGWLAMRTALERPTLFSGVVGISGAYSVSGLRAVSGSDTRFFGPEDDLSLLTEPLKAACPGLKIRIVHARDDWKVPYADAVKFADQVKAAGCPVEVVTFDTGGHNIAIPIDEVAEGTRLTEAAFRPFAP